MLLQLLHSPMQIKPSLLVVYGCLFYHLCTRAGQTGAGKTHTMNGSGEGGDGGLTGRAIEAVYRAIAQRAAASAASVYSVTATCLEIYNEQVSWLPRVGHVLTICVHDAAPAHAMPPPQGIQPSDSPPDVTFRPGCASAATPVPAPLRPRRFSTCWCPRRHPRR